MRKFALSSVRSFATAPDLFSKGRFNTAYAFGSLCLFGAGVSLFTLITDLSHY